MAARSSRSTITQEERDFVEEWENSARYQNAIIRLDVRGEEVHSVVEGEGRRFMLTTEERILTETKIRDDKLNPFKNGAFRPITVPAGLTVDTNPNALADEEIIEIFASSELAWGEYLKVIDSPATLQRMIELADAQEGLTVKRLRALEARLTEVKPPTRLEVKDAELRKFLSDDPAGTPRERRGQGGRSAAYRDN